jgi:hypothetical protein
MKLLRDTSEWAKALAELPAAGPLPARTALIPSETVAFALRKELLAAGRGDVLCGTRFLTLPGAARETLLAAGVDFVEGEERLRPLRVAALRPDLTPAWTLAWARTLGSLEEAGVAPDGDELGRLAAELDAAAGRSWTRARMLARATGRPWPFPGAVLAVLDAVEAGAARRFVEGIPGVVALESRPEARRGGEVELQGGVDEEVEAAARWALERARTLPLDEIAILVPRRDPWSAIVEERLSRAGLPAVVIGGLPAATTGAAARTLALVRGLRDHLSRRALAGLLPALRAGDGHLSAARSLELAQSLGTLGGSAVHPAGGLAWAARARARLPVLRARLAAGDEAHPEDVERRIDDLEAILPALEALVALARQVLEGARPFEPFLALVDRWLLRPGADGAAWPAQLAEELRPLVEDPMTGAVRGAAALAAIEEVVARARRPRGRLGEPAITVAAIEEAQHLRFGAARVLGLCEGSFPAAPREDPLVPAALRSRVPGPTDAFARQRRALERVLANCGEVALSAPKVDLEGSAREPSAVLLELADGFAVRPRPLPRPTPRPPPAAPPTPTLAIESPGLSPSRPVSARQLGMLLRCPHRYLVQEILHLRPPLEESPAADLDPLRYGVLFHHIAERFYRAHGEAFGARRGTLADWQARAAAIGDEALTELAEEVALAGAAVRAQLGARLRRDLCAFLEHDWAGGVPRRFIAVEEPFGFDAPVTIQVGGRALYLRGKMDRLDVEDGRLLVRDLKTGRAHPRHGKGEAPDPDRAYVYPAAQGERERAFREDAPRLDQELSRWLEVAVGLLEARRFPRTPDPNDCTHCELRPVCGPGAQERDAAALAAEATGPLAAFRALKGEPR